MNAKCLNLALIYLNSKLHSKEHYLVTNTYICIYICEFGQLWRLPESEQCKIGSLLSRYKLFKIAFLTTFIPIKTLYDQI